MLKPALHITSPCSRLQLTAFFLLGGNYNEHRLIWLIILVPLLSQHYCTIYYKTAFFSLPMSRPANMSQTMCRADSEIAPLPTASNFIWLFVEFIFSELDVRYMIVS
jgi:hypothetical protein